MTAPQAVSAPVALVVDDEPIVLRFVEPRSPIAQASGTQVLLVSGYDPEHTEWPWPFLRKHFAIENPVHAVGQLASSKIGRS